jgi:4-amino-4-deoxy-L-arabinose transferase-like glycosyltransferase
MFEARGSRGAADLGYASDVAERKPAGSGMLAWTAIALTLLFLVLRLYAAATSGLFFDEAYYWQWSTQLSPGYFDHPPMIAVFVRIGTLIFGDTTLGIRFMPALSAPLSVLAVWGIADRLTGNRRTAAWAAIFANLTGAAAMSIAALPDEPMVLFWLAATFALVSIYRGGAPGWWIVAGVMIGLAGSSKYTAALLAIGLFTWTLWEPTMRRWYRTPWPWLGAAAMLLAMSPVLIWNTANGWPSLLMQTMRDGLAGSQLDSFVEYLGLVVLMSSPAILILALVTMARGPQRALLLLAITPMFLFLALFSQADEVTSNSIWPIAYWLPIPAAMTLAGFPRWWTRGLAALAVLLGVVLMPTAYLLLSLPAGVAPDRLDLGRSYRGWPEAAMAIEDARQANGAAYIVADRYFYPGLLKLTLGRDAPAFHLASPQHDSDYSRWRRWNGFPSAKAEMATAKAIFIGGEAAARAYYESVEPLPPAVRPTGAAEPPALPLWLVSTPRPETAPLFNNWQVP